MNKNKIIKLTTYILCVVFLLVVLTSNLVFRHLSSNTISNIFLALISVALIGICYGFWSKNNAFFKLFIVISILIVGVYAIYFAFIKTGLVTHIDSFYDIKMLILKYKNQGILIYTIINFLQVTFVPLPSSVTILAGTAIFGPFLAFVFATIGIMLGSILAFFIGRFCSKPILYWIFGKEKVEKYEKLLSSRTKLILFLTLFLPFFPDDMICMLAGITDIKFKDFLFIALFSRSFGIACLSYFGSGKIIPFSGWGIGVWIALLIVGLLLIFFVYLKRKKIIKIFSAKKSKIV